MTSRPLPQSHASGIQPAGNFYDKYGTRNPVARLLMRRFLGTFENMLGQCTEARSALEVGCGEGELSIRVARRGIATSGVDIASEIIDEARRRAKLAGVAVTFANAGLLDLDPSRSEADLIICCEVMEHLDDPCAALDRLQALCRYRMIVSVPREPVWRALNMLRGKYLRSMGNTPGHVQHWSSRQFRKLLEKHFHIIDMQTPLPWTMALCAPRN